MKHKGDGSFCVSIAGHPIDRNEAEMRGRFIPLGDVDEEAGWETSEIALHLQNGYRKGVL